MNNTEVLACDKCGWKVPVTSQAKNTKCWSCLEGIQIETPITIKELNDEKRMVSRNIVKASLATRNL